ncbi:MAG: ABC transporter ATP-binding protein [Gaiella sp.]
MLELEFDHPGTPDTRSVLRFLAWTARLQWPTLLAAMTFGALWMSTQAVTPYVIGRAIDEGLDAGDHGRLALWTGTLLALGCFQAVAGAFRHGFSVMNWLISAFRFARIVGHHVARTATAVKATQSTGEVVATVSNDALRTGGAYDVLARLSGAVASYVVVAVVLLTKSTTLGLVVLIGVPVLALSMSGVIRPLHHRQTVQRREVGKLTALGADTAAGLRVLRGIGGEAAFLTRYRSQSDEVRLAGARVATPQATLDSAQVLLPGLLIVLVTWLGSRLVIDGTLQPGDLVAFYGSAAFLVLPLRTAGEAVERFTRANVGSRRMLRILAIEPQIEDSVQARAEPPAPAVLADRISGLVVEPGRFVCLVSATPEESTAVADRLGRFVPDPGVTLGGVPLTSLPSSAVHRRILLSESDPVLFSGTLRSELDPRGEATDAQIEEAIDVADAGDVLAALEDGLDEQVDERGRSFSGGQRQRLVLARAVLFAPEILILIEPTSAVDAHTEARVADRLHEARRGRTTVVVTASPLVLDRADEVVWLVNGVATDTGTHRELLRRRDDYRSTVTRGEV